MSEEYFTVEEAATRLRVSLETVRRWCRAGRLPTVKIGRAHRIPLKAVLALADPTTPRPEPAPRAPPAERPVEHARQPPAHPRRPTPSAADDPDEQLPAGWTRADPMPDEWGAGYGGRVVIIE
jgi:excisionase family DNA binding protein